MIVIIFHFVLNEDNIFGDIEAKAYSAHTGIIRAAKRMILLPSSIL